MKIKFLDDDKAPKVRKPHKCLILIRLKSNYVTEELKYYLQMFLEELKVNNITNAQMSCNTFVESDVIPESDGNVDDSEFIVEKPC